MKYWPLLVLTVVTVALTRELWPRKEVTQAPPMITTVHDTTHDTLRMVVPKAVPGPNLIIRETIHETTYVNVGAEPAERTNLFPVLGVKVGSKVGDTTVVLTFGLRTGQGATVKVYTAGPLLGVYADSLPTPRLLFGPAPTPHRTSTLTKLLWGGLGYGACAAVSAVH